MLMLMMCVCVNVSDDVSECCGVWICVCGCDDVNEGVCECVEGKNCGGVNECEGMGRNDDSVCDCGL